MPYLNRFPLEYFDNKKLVSDGHVIFAMYFSDYTRFLSSRGNDVSRILNATDKYILNKDHTIKEEYDVMELIEIFNLEWYNFLNFFYNRQKILIDIKMTPIFPKYMINILKENNKEELLIEAMEDTPVKNKTLTEENLYQIEKYNSKNKFLIFGVKYLDYYQRQ